MEMNYGRLLLCFFLAASLSGCIFDDRSSNKSEQNYPSLAYLYVDVQIEADLVVASEPEYSVASEVWSPNTSVSDGIESTIWPNADFDNPCRTDTDWKAPSACDGVFSFTAGYEEGVTISINSVIGQGNSVSSKFTAEALIPLN